MDRLNVVPELIQAPQLHLNFLAFGMFTHDELVTLLGTFLFLQVLVVKVVIYHGGPVVLECPLLE